MDHHQATYMSYLLRLWLEDDTGSGRPEAPGGEWRASLEDPHTQVVQVFATLEALIDFLLKETRLRASGEDARSRQKAGAANQVGHLPGA